jgi:hypothetical protein
MKTTKTIFFAITVVLLSLLTTSCIPTTPGGNPTPGNQFDINISDENITSTGTTPGGDIISKKILVDDDSIEFSLKRSSAIMCGNCMETFKIVFKNTTTNYESLVLNNTDSTYNITIVACLLTIPIPHMVPFIFTNNQYMCASMSIPEQPMQVRSQKWLV